MSYVKRVGMIMMWRVETCRFIKHLFISFVDYFLRKHYTNLNWKTPWNGNECEKEKLGNKNVKPPNPNTDYDRSKTARECEILEVFW
jgi:hypothetical protein